MNKSLIDFQLLLLPIRLIISKQSILLLFMDKKISISILLTSPLLLQYKNIFFLKKKNIVLK